MAFDDTVVVPDDGLPCPEVGPWAEVKHNLVSYYAKQFSTGMKRKWDKRIYIELYAGAGYGRIRDTAKRIMGSPLRALTLPDPFDRYIFCEEDPELIKALELRARKLAPSADIICIAGDCNTGVSDILKAIPVGSKEDKVLSLCLVDPCDLGIKFRTISALSTRYIGFLVLLALCMDGIRAYQHYLKPRSAKIAEFLDSSDWHLEWVKAQSEGTPFARFLVEAFSRSMEKLRYIHQPIYKMKEVMFLDKNWPLYRLALFSRNPLAYELWDDVLKYSTNPAVFGRRIMAVISKIEWTDATWNPVRGCTKISPGCKHCYAETFAERFRGVKGHPYEQGFDLRLIPEKLTEPFSWRSPKLVFVNSMSDLFQPGVPDEYAEAVSRVMVKADWHTYQVLTKRSERLSDLLNDRLRFAAKQKHIWWGVSVEDRKYGLPRIEHLRNSPAVVRFLSVEPLLEDLGEMNLDGISWVIVGGESGPGARPLRKEWVVSIREQCQGARVPFFFKQWGGTRKARYGRELDGRTYDEYPTRQQATVPERGACLELARAFLHSTRGSLARLNLGPLTVT